MEERFAYKATGRAQRSAGGARPTITYVKPDLRRVQSPVQQELLIQEAVILRLGDGHAERGPTPPAAGRWRGDRFNRAHLLLGERLALQALERHQHARHFDA